MSGSDRDAFSEVDTAVEQKILRLRALGWTEAGIARQTGEHVATVRFIINRHEELRKQDGRKPPRNQAPNVRDGRSGRIGDPVLCARAARLQMDGKTLAQIGALLKCSAVQAGKMIAKHYGHQMYGLKESHHDS